MSLNLYRAIFGLMFCIEGISLMWGCYIFFGQFSDWTADPEESTHFYCNAVICNNNTFNLVFCGSVTIL